MKFDPRVNLAIILTLLVQTASGLLWAGHAAERLEQVESALTVNANLVERMAKVEVHLIEAQRSLDRIERTMEGMRGRR
jgi:hypothetical protein